MYIYKYVGTYTNVHVSVLHFKKKIYSVAVFPVTRGSKGVESKTIRLRYTFLVIPVLDAYRISN